MNSCNVIYNEETTKGTYGVVYSEGSLNIIDSCLMNNNATFTVRGDKNVNFDGCSIDFGKSSTGGVTGTVTFESTVRTDFVNRIQCYETMNCDSEYDAIDDIVYRIIKDERYTAANTKNNIRCNTLNILNKKISLKQESSKALTYAVLISLAPTDSSNSI